MTIPTVQESVDAAVAAMEARLGQDVPLYSKSFLNALSVVLGMNNAELYRFGEQRAKQVLALTAQGDDLTNLGREYRVIRKPAQKSIIEVLVASSPPNPVNVYRSDTMYSEDNGMYYFPIQDYSFIAGTPSCNIEVRAEFAGSAGDINTPPQKILYWNTPPDGIETTGGFVTDVTTPGADEETDDELRIRVLTEVQTVGGGSNEADYRTWGLRTPNVLRIDPYTGTPPWSGSQPGYRTVFVEATSSYEPDGIADTTLLDLVRDYITYDQDTGVKQICLGSTDDTLNITSITRNTAYFQVNNLEVEATLLSACQADISAELDALARSLTPYVMGLDTETFKNNVLSSSVAAREVQRVVQAYGGSVGVVNASLSLGSWDDPPYTLNPGERLKASVSYG